jgi:hypothetical protein
MTESPQGVQWHIVDKSTGDPVDEPMNGFGSQAEAEEFHMGRLKGDPSLEVRVFPRPRVDAEER